MACPHVDGASSRATGSTSSIPSDTVTSRTPCDLRLLQHRGEPRLALVPPVSEQLGVERAAEQAAVLEPLRHPGHEVAGVLARERQRRLVVVGLARVAPRPQVVNRAAPVVPVERMRRVAVLVVPDELDGLPVDRHGHRPRPRWRPAAGGRSPPPRSGPRRTPARRRPPAHARGPARTRTPAARSRRTSGRTAACARRSPWRAGAAGRRPSRSAEAARAWPRRSRAPRARASERRRSRSRPRSSKARSARV